jgi:hypothetical protein
VRSSQKGQFESIKRQIPWYLYRVHPSSAISRTSQRHSPRYTRCIRKPVSESSSAPARNSCEKCLNMWIRQAWRLTSFASIDQLAQNANPMCWSWGINRWLLVGISGPRHLRCWLIPLNSHGVPWNHPPDAHGNPNRC